MHINCLDNNNNILLLFNIYFRQYKKNMRVKYL